MTPPGASTLVAAQRNFPPGIGKGQTLKTYRLLMVGEADGIVYGIKEYEAENDGRAAELAEQLCGQHPDDLVWQGQPLTTRLRPVDASLGF